MSNKDITVLFSRFVSVRGLTVQLKSALEMKTRIVLKIFSVFMWRLA